MSPGDVMDNFKIVKIDSNYCDYLRKFDNRVVYNEGIKELRPFIGVLFTVNKCKYYAPLSSPKAKHLYLKNTLDLIKIAEGTLGVINLNSMIPVKENNYTPFDLNTQPTDDKERKSLILLRNQLRWLTSHKGKVLNKAENLYKKYVMGLLPKNVV